MNEGLDLADPQFRRDPYPQYRLLRDRSAVHWSRSATAWVLVRYDDVRTVLSDGRFAHWTESLQAAPSPFLRSIARWLWLLHPQSKSSLREHVYPLFTTAAAEGFRAQIAEHARQLAVQSVSFDLVDDFAGPLSMSVAASLLGVPSKDRATFASLAGNAMRNFESIWNGQLQDLAPFVQFLTGLDRSDGFLAAVDLARKEGDQIAPDEVLAFAILFLFAAQENIKSFIATAVLGLAKDRTAWESVRTRRDLIPAAVDELLRFDSPVQFVALRAREDVEIGGQIIQQGDNVLAGIAAANRDPAAFADPERLDFGRKNASHLTFGAGAFYCMGAAHARVQAQEGLSAILTAFEVPFVKHDSVQWKTFPLVLRGPSSARIYAQQIQVSERTHP